MKVICNRGALQEALSIAGTVSSGRTPKPVLQCVKLTVSEDRLTIAATDLEVAIRYSDTQVQVEQQGETLVMADKLRDIVRESVDDTLSLELHGDQLHIKGQDSHFKIFTQNPAEFPPVPDFEGNADFQVQGKQLKQLISQTLFAAAKEATRYAFNGVLTTVKGRRLIMVATDGRRLAMAKGDLLDGDKAQDGGLSIVPAKTLNLVDKLISNPDEPVMIKLTENQVIFHTNEATLTSNLIEGQFPPYEDVIPKECDRKMVAGTADLLSAVRRSALLTTNDSKGVRMTFTKKGLTLSSRNPDAGEATINFACKFDGPDVEIGFNPMFMTDALKVVNTDEITFELLAPNRPGLLKGGPNFTYVIMPVNLT
ncbi:MAG: DNA polymerase III subunit beta [Burkholderiales bacterium]|nr:DNA polymerase III subunit beta [Phycisphaerae bacterium]